MNFVIRTDAAVGIGTGHVMRCIALGQMLLEEGNNVIFLTQTNNEKILDKLNREGFKFVRLFQKVDLDDDAKFTVQLARDERTDWIITDGYKFVTEYQKEIKKNNFKLMCIDDIAICHYVCDIILNQNINADKVFSYSHEPYTKLFLGIKYILFRKEFRDKISVKSTNTNKITKLLITLGGGDEENFTLKILYALELFAFYALDIKVLLGANFRYGKEIKFYTSKSRHCIEVYRAVDNVVPIMEWCDLAVSACGSTIWELLKLNKKIVTFIVAENQERIAVELGKLKLLKNSGWINKLDINEIYETLKDSIYQGNITGIMRTDFIDQLGSYWSVNKLNIFKEW